MADWLTGGKTPLGAKLHSKIILPIYNQLVKNQQLKKPILVIILTDGIPDSEREVKEAILASHKIGKNSKYGAHSIAYSFAQIGSDAKATRFLNQLDVDDEVGDMIDCHSNFEEEKKQCGGNFTASHWMVKLMVGAVDPSYDKADEEAHNNNHNNNNNNSHNNNNNAGGGAGGGGGGGSSRSMRKNDDGCSLQ